VRRRSRTQATSSTRPTSSAGTTVAHAPTSSPACEELGKLPILTTAAASQHIGHDVDWKRIDRVLRDHAEKIKKVLFMDSIVGGEGLAAGAAAYEADVARMRAYTDTKNASLYSFPSERQFARPLDAFPCEFYDSFRPLAEGRAERL
jgi:AbiV family abortive infection protein